MMNRSSYKSYTSDALEKAYELVRTKQMNLSLAAKYFGIPKSTMSDKVRGKGPFRRPKCNTALTNEEEEQLVSWLEESAKIGCGQTKQQLLTAVQQILKSSDRLTPFKDDKPGNKWYHNFLKRHPKVSIRKRQPASTVPSSPLPTTLQSASSSTILQSASSSSTLQPAISSLTNQSAPSSSLPSFLFNQSTSASTLSSSLSSSSLASSVPSKSGLLLDMLLQHVVANQWTEATLSKMKMMYSNKVPSDDPQFAVYKQLYNLIISPSTYTDNPLPPAEEDIKTNNHGIQPCHVVSQAELTAFIDEEEREERRKVCDKTKRQKEFDTKRKRTSKNGGKAKKNVQRKIMFEDSNFDSEDFMSERQCIQPNKIVSGVDLAAFIKSKECEEQDSDFDGENLMSERRYIQPNKIVSGVDLAAFIKSKECEEQDSTFDSEKFKSERECIKPNKIVSGVDLAGCIKSEECEEQDSNFDSEKFTSERQCIQPNKIVSGVDHAGCIKSEECEELDSNFDSEKFTSEKKCIQPNKIVSRVDLTACIKSEEFEEQE